jgi:hypothetical protein
MRAKRPQPCHHTDWYSLPVARLHVYKCIELNPRRVGPGLLNTAGLVIPATTKQMRKRCFVSAVVREEGIEPSTGAWKALALPLRHSRVRGGFYPSRAVSSSASERGRQCPRPSTEGSPATPPAVLPHSTDGPDASAGKPERAREQVAQRGEHAQCGITLIPIRVPAYKFAGGFGPSRCDTRLYARTRLGIRSGVDRRTAREGEKPDCRYLLGPAGE